MRRPQQPSWQCLTHLVGRVGRNARTLLEAPLDLDSKLAAPAVKVRIVRDGLVAVGCDAAREEEQTEADVSARQDARPRLAALLTRRNRGRARERGRRSAR